VLKRGLLVLALLILCELGLWIWGLWPLSDPRFDWGRYFDEAVAAQNCDDATWLAANAVQLNEERALVAARQMSEAEWCPIGRKTFDARRMKWIEENLAQPGKRPGRSRGGYVWAPGWRGRWNALPWILREETSAVYSNARRREGWALAALKFPIEMPWSLRCSFALLEQPGMAYAAMRRRLARSAHPELALKDWDGRAEWCLRMEGSGWFQSH